MDEINLEEYSDPWGQDGLHGTKAPSEAISRMLTFSPQGVSMDIQRDTKLFQASLNPVSPEDLRRIAATLYCRVLALAGEISYYEGMATNNVVIASLEERLKIQIQRTELDRRKILTMGARIDGLQRDLEEARFEGSRASAKAKEMEETTFKLTEWNGQLEAKIRYMEADAGRVNERIAALQENLEAQIMQVTQKRIELQQAYSNLEEQASKLKRELQEQEEIYVKVNQENAILKAKLHRASESKHYKADPMRAGLNEVHEAPLPQGNSPTMSDVGLGDSQGRNIRDIFKSSFAAGPGLS